jgi:hypothetical protein
VSLKGDTKSGRDKLTEIYLAPSQKKPWHNGAPPPIVATNQHVPPRSCSRHHQSLHDTGLRPDQRRYTTLSGLGTAATLEEPPPPPRGSHWLDIAARAHETLQARPGPDGPVKLRPLCCNRLAAEPPPQDPAKSSPPPPGYPCRCRLRPARAHLGLGRTYQEPAATGVPCSRESPL